MHLKGKETLEQIYRILTEELTYGVDAKTLVEPIEKDLEVLEILKHNLYIQNNCDTAHVTFRQILCNIPSFNNDFQKIKEWLENDK